MRYFHFARGRAFICIGSKVPSQGGQVQSISTAVYESVSGPLNIDQQSIATLQLVKIPASFCAVGRHTATKINSALSMYMNQIITMSEDGNKS